jgi:hypothetical protein
MNNELQPILSLLRSKFLNKFIFKRRQKIMEEKVLLETKDGFTHVVALPENTLVREIDRDAEGKEYQYRYIDGRIQREPIDHEICEYNSADKQQASERFVVCWTIRNVLDMDDTNLLTVEDAKNILTDLWPDNLSRTAVKFKVQDFRVSK